MKNKFFLIPLLAPLILGLAFCADVTLEENQADTGSIPYSKIAINMFPRNKTAGSALSQMNDIKSLGINRIRINLWFDSFYMPNSQSSPNFDKFDEVVNAARSAGMEILAILHPVPNWLSGQSNWKSTFLGKYVSPVVARYQGTIKHWEVWNEPDNVDARYGVLDGTPKDYFSLLKDTSNAIRAIDPSAKIVSASAMSIVIEGLDKIYWTKSLIDMGLSQYADILNIHYYSELDPELGTIVKNIVGASGMPVWVTETGEQGQANQLSYFERVMPYIDRSLSPQRIYWYCYVEGAGTGERSHPGNTKGLITYWGGSRQESSLYSHLKNR